MENRTRPGSGLAVHIAWIAALVLYGGFVAWRFAPVAAGADSGGYFISARLIMEGRLSTELRTVEGLGVEHPGDVSPLGGVALPGTGEMRPAYPVGLPLHIAGAVWLLGWHWGPSFLGMVTAVGATVLTYVVLRQAGIRPWMAVAGATALAISPQHLHVAMLPLSDSLATLWVTAAICAALAARHRSAWALACGAALGVAVLVRPSNIIVLPALVVALGGLRLLVLAGLGGLPFAIGLAVYQKVQYGSPWSSGYGEVFELFSLDVVLPTIAFYAHWMVFLLPLVVLIPGLPWVRWRGRARMMAMLLLWAFAFFGFYALYPFTRDSWWFLRFVLPAFPALIVLSCYVAEAVAERLEMRSPDALRLGWHVLVAAAVLVVSLVLSVAVSRQTYIMRLKPDQMPYVAASDWLNKHLPADAVVAAMQMSPSLYFYTPFPVVRWDHTPPDRFAATVDRLTEQGRPVFAALFRFEYEDERWAQLPATWEKIAEVDRVSIFRMVAPDAVARAPAGLP